MYNIPKGTKDTKVHIRISIPDNATLGTEWTVRFKAIMVTEKEGGMVQIAGGVSDYFKVRTGPIPEQSPKGEYLILFLSNAKMLIVAGAVLFVIIALIMVYNKKNKPKKEG